VSSSASRAGDVAVELKADPTHPRWAKPSAAHFYVEAFGGWAFAGGLGSAAETDCDAGLCDGDGGASGPLVGVRGGYELGAGLALELSAGYLSLSKSIVRHRDASFGQSVSVRYDVSDELRLSAPFAALGLGYRVDLGKTLGLDARVHVGGMLARGRDRIDGTASTADETAQVTVERSGQAVTAAELFAMPALQLRLRLGSLHVGAGVAATWLLLEGPKNQHGEAKVVDQGRCDSVTNPDSVDCARGQDIVREERAFGSVFAVAPALSVGWTF